MGAGLQLLVYVDLLLLMWWNGFELLHNSL